MKNIKKATAVMLTVLLFGNIAFTLKGEIELKAAENTREHRKDVSVHDPSIIKDKDNTYYVFGSHITTAKSNDLIGWEYVARGYKTPENLHFGDLSQNLKGSFEWAGEDDGDCKGGFAVWAPDVYYNEKYLWSDGSRGAYMMYYSASSTYKRSCIGLAVSKKIEGPYQYVDTVIYSGFTKIGGVDENSTHSKKYTNTNLDKLIKKGRVCSYKSDWGIDDYNNIKYPNAIDPCVYEDDKGRLYLTYGSWSGGIFALRINELTGLPVYPGFDSVTEDGRMVDRYFGTHIAGGKGWSGEGAFIWYDERTDYYYLQTSYDWLGTDGGYHIRMFRSKNPLGPFTDIKGNSAVYGEFHHEHGVKMFGNYYFSSLSKPFTSGGHCSSIVDEDESYIVYHTRYKGTEHFTMKVHQMFLNEDGWFVCAPFEYCGDKIKEEGYSDDEITGFYEYINHGTGIGEGKKVNMPKTVILTQDGKVKGAAEGTWSKRGKYVTFDINTGTYKGVFFAQSDENGQKRMTFSLVGGENESIWGVKKDKEGTDVPACAFESNLDGELGDFVKVERKKNENPAQSELEGAEYADGIIGNALKLDGNYGIKAENITPSESFTISFWMKPDEFKSYTPIVALTEDFIAQEQKWFSLTSFNDGKNAMIWSRNAESEQWIDGKAEVGYKIGVWQHITITFDEKYDDGDSDCVYARLYIDGLCVATGSVTKGALTENSRIYFGVNPWDSGFKGLIDEIKVFNKTLSDWEVLENYYSYDSYKGETD